MSMPQQFRQLTEALLPPVQKLMMSGKNFLPSAAFVNEVGEADYSTVDLSVHSTPQAIHEALIASLAAGVNEAGYVAVGIATDGHSQLPDGSSSDAILLALEHISGQSIMVVVPYKQDASRFEFGESVAYPRKPLVFGPVQDN